MAEDFFLCKGCEFFFVKLFNEMGDTLVLQEDSNLLLGIKIISWNGSTHTISPCLIVAFLFAFSFLIILQGFVFFFF